MRRGYAGRPVILFSRTLTLKIRPPVGRNYFNISLTVTEENNVNYLLLTSLSIAIKLSNSLAFFLRLLQLGL